MHAAKKYLVTMSLAIQGAMEYRANFLLSLLSGSFTVIVQYFLWTAVYSGNAETVLFGYDYKQMIVYVIMAGVMYRVTVSGLEWEIAYDIKNDGLSRFLVQPIRYMPYRIMNFLGQKIVQVSVFFFIAVGVLVILHFTMGVQYDLSQMWLLVFAVILGVILNCIMFYCYSAIAFWVTEVGGLFMGMGAITTILSGGFFPLDVFGYTALSIFRLLPFQYVTYFPLNILSGRYNDSEIWIGMGIQLVWIIFFWVLAKILWHFGMKKYIAVGG